MKASAIIPVKSFSKSKSRLNLPESKVQELCETMLKEILQVISETKLVDDILLVSKDESAFKIGKKFDCVEIIDEKESGVNDAVALASNYLIENDCECSVVLPQDIPLIFAEDLNNLLSFYQNTKNAIVIPSRHLDGTNALVRKPKSGLKTRYDEGSYRFQFEPLKAAKIKYSLGLIHRIMIDVDSASDVNYVIKQNTKPMFCNKMREIFSG